MKPTWPKVRLDEVLQRSEEIVVPMPDTEYREITVRLWGRGVVERGRVDGATLAGSRRYRARSGQFIASRIDARNGAMGIVPDELDGAVVTNDFPLFNLSTDRVVPSFGWLSRTRAFVELCHRGSEGTTNRVRLKEDRFLALDISLPTLEEQRRVVKRIEELAAHIHQARSLGEQTLDETEALIRAGLVVSSFRGSFALRFVGEVCTVIDPNPSHRYPAYVPHGIPIISSSDFVGEDSIDLSRARRVPESFYHETLGRFGVGEGDVIFSRKGTLGYARAHPPSLRLAMTHTLCVLQPNRAVIEPRYLLHLTRGRAFLEPWSERQPSHYPQS